MITLTPDEIESLEAVIILDDEILNPDHTEIWLVTPEQRDEIEERLPDSVPADFAAIPKFNTYELIEHAKKTGFFSERPLLTDED